MDAVHELANHASQYPKNQAHQGSFPFMLDLYHEQLNARERRLFHTSDKARVWVSQCWAANQSFEETCLKNFGDLRKHLGLVETNPRHDPICRFFFVQATHGRERLMVTREMLTLVLSYYQMLPSFLEFLFPFGRQTYEEDFHFGGFRYQTRLFQHEQGLVVPELGWSGRDFRMCYNLKSAERIHDSDTGDWPWFISQCAIHHSFDVASNQVSWMVVKGDEVLRNRIASAIADQTSPNVSFHNFDRAFASSLLIHLIFCEWSGQSWRWYVNFLEGEFQSSTRRVASTPLEDPPMPTNDANNLRHRHGPAASSLPFPVTRGNTSHTTSRNIPVQPVAPPSPRNSQTDSQGTQLSLTALESTQKVEEKVNEANLVLKVNLSILEELKQAYKILGSSLDLPTNTVDGCWRDLVRFEQRISSIQNDFGIQQSRVETLLRLIADRKTLLYGVLEQQKTRMNMQQAELAQRSAQNMEEMTRTVQDLTVDMHRIAGETRQETISMRIMALIGLLFLPETFVSTLMSTNIFQASSHEEYVKAIGQFFAISVPLLPSIVLVWYCLNEWYKKKARKELKYKE